MGEEEYEFEQGIVEGGAEAGGGGGGKVGSES